MSENKDKYKVIQASNGGSLEKALNEARTEGWQLHSFSTSIYPNHKSSTQKVIILAVLERRSSSNLLV